MSSASTPGEGAGIYVHFPFCSAICPYCDFAVLTARPERRNRYPALLVREIESLAGIAGDFPAMDTIYLGGGTPSMTATEDLESILSALERYFPLGSSCRLHMEANPEDVTRDAAVAWRGLGTRFLSLGVQSLDPASLRFLGRRHTPDEARRACAAARAAGIETVSVDLIFGLPDRCRAELERDLEEILQLEPDHVSCYQLTVESGTHFARKRASGSLAELASGEQAERYALVQQTLAQAGLHVYEVSNFARDPRHESRHNRKYWRHAPYLGVGPSAHSFHGDRRWWNVRLLDEWERRIEAGESIVAGEETLTLEQQAFEHVMLGLRTTRGVDLQEMKAGFGVDLKQTNREILRRLEEEGLLRILEGRLCPTAKGLAVADGLARSLEIKRVLR